VSPRGPFAVSPRGPFAVSPRGPFAVSPRGPFAVSPRGPFAVSPRGPFAVSPRGPFAVSPRGPFAVSPTGSAPAEQAGPADPFQGLPEPVRRAALREVLNARPQRATDIFYEDSDLVYAMRNGIQYVLSSPVSQVWRRLGDDTLEAILDAVAEELNLEDASALHGEVVRALLAAEAAGLLVLYPKEPEEL
ncbi:hypothetical protein, partial [Rhodospirillum rubrum]